MNDRVTFMICILAGVMLAMGPAQASDPGARHSATVLETMDSSGYTYMKVEENGRSYWTAGPPVGVAPGDQVTFVAQMRMQDFRSSSLDRTFDELIFVNQVSGGEPPPAGHPPVTAPRGHPPVTAAAPEYAAGTVARAEGGQTVAEVFDRRRELAGQTVKVRGRVVKVNSNIMGSHWVHLADGSGAPGRDHVVFRSPADEPAEGSVVTGTGTLAVDRDLGFGYEYPVLVEDASFTK